MFARPTSFSDSTAGLFHNTLKGEIRCTLTFRNSFVLLELYDSLDACLINAQYAEPWIYPASMGSYSELKGGA